MGSPKSDALSTQMQMHAVRLVMKSTINASKSPLALDGIYRPIGAAFPNNPTRRQRLRGATGSGHDGLSPSLAPLSRELGPGPSLRTLLRLQFNAKTPDFQAGLFPAFDQTIDDLTRIEFTTACQDAPGILSSDFGQPRAQTCLAEGLGRNLRSKTRWFTDSAIHTKYRISPRSSSMRAEISAASRFRLYIAALPPTNTASGWRKQAA
ncbi:hypothetical protein Bca101_101782 [Brassica carinata]